MNLKEVNSFPFLWFCVVVFLIAAIFVLVGGVFPKHQPPKIIETELELSLSDIYRGIHLDLGKYDPGPGPKTDLALFEVPDYFIERDSYGPYFEIVTEKARYKVRVEEVIE